MKESTSPHVLADWARQAQKFAANDEWKPDPKDSSRRLLTGEMLSIVALAYDLFLLACDEGIPEALLRRLRLAREFQGAAYETAIAGCFARCGFKVEWCVGAQKHPEFIARHPTTQELFAVEAKSRQWPGVLRAPTRSEEPAPLRQALQRLYKEAVSHHTGPEPLLVFLDVNRPPEPGVQVLDKSWIEDVKGMLNDLPLSTEAAPSPDAVVGITNFAWHYQRAESASSAEVVLLVSGHSKAPVQNWQTVEALRDALARRGCVPETDEDPIAEGLRRIFERGASPPPGS
jgi:hypothetical protein